MGVKKRVNNSIGTNEAELYYRKKCGKLTQSEFRKAIRKVNENIQQAISLGEDIELPNRMGIIEVRKFKTKVEFVDGKMKTNLVVDWAATKKLWSEDEWCKKNKKLVRCETDFIYRIYYKNKKANYKNKVYMKFYPNRTLQRTLSRNIKDGKVDAFLVN